MMQTENRRKMKALFTALAMMLACAFAFTGCSAYDPTGLVKANLDYMVTGEVTDELLSLTDQTEEQLKQAHDEDITAAVDLFIAEMQIENYLTDEMRAGIEEFVATALQKGKFEVSKEFTEKNGGYVVKVDVYPMDFLTTAQERINSEYIPAWEEKIRSGEYVYTTDEQLYTDIYNDLFDKVTQLAAETGYGEAVKMTVRIEEKDGALSPVGEDLEAIGKAMLGQQN